MKKQQLCKHLPFLLAALLTGVMTWYHHVYVNWNASLFPVAVALSVLVFLALAISVVWPGEAKPLWKCLRIFGWLAVFVGVQQGVSFWINNVVYHAVMGAKPAMRVVLPLLAVLVILPLLKPWLALNRKGKALVAGILCIGVLASWGGSEAIQYVQLRSLTSRVPFAEVAMKARSTIFTPEKRAAMMENTASEAFREQVEETLAKADFYAENIDTFYNMVVAEGLPRYYFTGTQSDPERHCCRYCGVNLWEEYGRYSWLADAFEHPWKIQCPACERRFPSNDFAGYYKLGLDERGVFQPAQAKERNDAIVEAGEDGYLKNILYPEKGEGWGVDDGFGYRTGHVDGNGTAERHLYIAYYIHDGVWDGTAQGRAGSVRTALSTLQDAYLYTGDEKYGRAGAVLLGRIADVYPGFDWSLWNEVRGYSGVGTIIDQIWGTYLASSFCQAYDAFFPVMDEAMRLNVENGILRTVYRFALNGQLGGNFGMKQRMVTAAAVVLDTMPETGEWLDWVMAPGGGDVAGRLIGVVDRDGMNNEAAPNYNQIPLNDLMDMANLLDGYDTYPAADLYKNPKFVQMLYSQVPVIMANYYTAQIGDGGQTASPGFTLNPSIALAIYRKTNDPVFAQFLYLANGNSVEGLSEGIAVKNPFKIQEDARRVIEEQGELNLPSMMMAGYGFAALRQNPRSDFWMYFGLASGHGHADSLNLGIDAYGLNMAPELGYPEDTAGAPHGPQWSNATLSHNTVIVDGQSQLKDGRKAERGRPLHFDDSGRVKLMDVDNSAAYDQTSEYRRTVVMIEVDEDVSYGVDFFRVMGGNEHLYSFHSQSDEIFATENLTLVPQKTGTYAGPDVPWGPDSNTANVNVLGLRYPAGFTWLDHVRRTKNPGKTFAVDFAVKDFWGVLEDSENLHLRMTQLNDFDLDEVAIARGYPPKLAGNPEYLEYVLARRTGKNLDSLFTTVFEPYKSERYIAKIEGVGKTVKITHVNGRMDVIEYMPDDAFIRVSIYAPDGELEYRYTNDAQAYTGKVLSFTKELSLENSIQVKIDQPVDPAVLAGKYIYIENDGKQSGAYRIESAKLMDDGSVTLDIGRVSPVQGLKSKTKLDSFVYNIKAGQGFRIPMPAIEER